VIERYLSRHAGSCYSGSGDWNFAWLNSLIQTTWHDRSFAVPPRPAPSRHHDWLDEFGADGPNQRQDRRAAVVAPDFDAKRREKATDTFSTTKDTKSGGPRQVHQPQRSASRPSGQMPGPSPKKIDMAVAWLRAELASSERAAAEVEASAHCAGIAPRTYDRARQRLGVTSRRIGFGRWAKYMIALPTVHGTPSEGANKVGAA
jgi:hypothetical protein